MALTIDVSQKKPGLFEVVLDGRLDTDTSPSLEKKMDEVLAGSPRAVRFVMADVNYLSSMGIRVLFKTFKALRQKKAMFLMADLQPQVKKVLDIAQALPPESVFASVEEADEYFDAMQKKVLEQGNDGH